MNPADNNNLAIRWASENGHLEVVKFLISDLRMNPADANKSAIRLASCNSYLEWSLGSC